jgi:hypothetical protein
MNYEQLYDPTLVKFNWKGITKTIQVEKKIASAGDFKDIARRLSREFQARIDSSYLPLWQVGKEFKENETVAVSMNWSSPIDDRVEFLHRGRSRIVRVAKEIADQKQLDVLLKALNEEFEMQKIRQVDLPCEFWIPPVKPRPWSTYRIEYGDDPEIHPLGSTRSASDSEDDEEKQIQDESYELRTRDLYEDPEDMLAQLEGDPDDSDDLLNDPDEYFPRPNIPRVIMSSPTKDWHQFGNRLRADSRSRESISV